MVRDGRLAAIGLHHEEREQACEEVGAADDQGDPSLADAVGERPVAGERYREETPNRTAAER